MATVVRGERGSALMLAVIAMLVMGVLSVSFALLADMETKIGVSYKQQAAAEALAEAGLERARDFVRTAPSAPGGFTNWFNGTSASHNLFSNVPLVGGTYSARLDNDCFAANTVPTYIEEKAHPPGATPCDNVTDYNETAVITAWSQAGNGRARVRAIVAVDNPWKHVCSDAKADNNGYCNDPGNRNGNPTVSPADPNDPNGPSAYNNLPRPTLGCSRIAPELHRGPYLAAIQTAQCKVTFPGMYTYPYPVAFNVVPRFVLMGDDPATNPNAKKCNNEPNAPAAGHANTYFGYFDCALTSYCNPLDAGHVCGGFPHLMGAPAAFRTGCLKGRKWYIANGTPPGLADNFADTRVLAGHPNQMMLNPGFTLAFPPPAGVANVIRWGEWDPAVGLCVNSAGTSVTSANTAPGLVFSGAAFPAGGGTVNFNGTVGSQTKQFDVYVFRAAWTQGNNIQFYGTLAVETNGAGGVQFQVGNGNATKLWSGANSNPPAVGWADPTTDPPGSYGYPLVALIYDPFAAPPTVVPLYAPQNHTSDMGSNNTELHGMIYSGGHVQFNPLTMDGTVVAFEIQTQGSATYTYNPWYGNNTPPPGFPTGSTNTVVIIRKSFVVCVNYSDDGAGATTC